MAITESIHIAAHYNMYNGSSGRELRIEIALPEAGTNKDTGFFIFVPGFGGHIDSNVYKKMRERFADQYNVVSIQCDYFGSKFMQSANNVRLKNNINELAHLFSEKEFEIVKKNASQILPMLSDKGATVSALANQIEQLDEFADMGYMQAIDVITAVEATKLLLEGNNLLYDTNRVIGFGQSQGAYLLHLCNRLTPHLFSMIIDNSAWVFPAYLRSNRVLSSLIGASTLHIEFDYLAKRVIEDKLA